MEDTFVEVQGARVHYVHAGVGPPLVLIHGMTGSTANWRRNIEALSRVASVYAVDLVNMGKSERVGTLDSGLAATADRVAAWMDAVGLRRADIVGHSLGGAIALMLASRHPEVVRSLLLFAPANPYSNLGNGLVRLFRSPVGRPLMHLAPYLPRWIQMLALAHMYGDPRRIAAGSLEGYIVGMKLPGSMDHILAIARGWHGQMAALAAALPDVPRVPALLVWGDRDRAVSPASGVRLQQDLKGSELLVIKGAGHIVFEELPEEANRAMFDWLAQVAAGAIRPDRQG